nr:hypothetical protein [uncultured Treponema sp.]
MKKNHIEKDFLCKEDEKHPSRLQKNVAQGKIQTCKVSKFRI